MNASHLVAEQRSYFARGDTLDISFRRQQLEQLYSAVDRRSDDIAAALRKDLGKGTFEAYSTEIGFSLRNIRKAARSVSRWSRPRRAGQSLFVFPSVNRIYREPYGVTLVIGPFNYPFQLVIEPLIGAIAGGNTCIVKPSEQAPHTAAVLSQLLAETFPPEYIVAVEGGKEVIADLLENQFDYIFFTGSARVGKVIAEAAGRSLTPVTLELGGKAPAIVDHTANLPAAARKIVWGKFLNAGQNCGAPDYVLVEDTVHDELVEQLRRAITQFYGNDPSSCPDYGRIATSVHWDRLDSLLASARNKIVHGGVSDRNELYIAPTILDHVDWGDQVMEGEIFGPILPVLNYQRSEFQHDVIDAVNTGEKPLALYIFASDRSLIRQILRRISFGGGCVNDTIMQFSHPGLPFGGVGNSGMGAYHGRHSFDTFTHAKSVLSHLPRQEMPLVYPPQGDGYKTRIVKRLLR
ncbi:aldehyde dehydrogenase [Arachnia propionica]|uniref:aldehyde dehydrogenase n=1 Tax=Arachnia propionica TaxID=1750 RepID=UPI0039902049